MEQVLRDALFKLAGELSLEALGPAEPEPDAAGRRWNKARKGPK